MLICCARVVWAVSPNYEALALSNNALLFGREVLGAVAAAKPSGVFRTGWPTNDQMRSCGVAQLGVSIESEVRHQVVYLQGVLRSSAACSFVSLEECGNAFPGFPRHIYASGRRQAWGCYDPRVFRKEAALCFSTLYRRR